MMTAIFFFTGIIIYSLIEYAVHRWVLHGPMIKKHRLHHQKPEMKMTVPFRCALVVFLITWFITNLPVALGIVACWLLSSAIHHRLHVDTPEKWWVMRLKKHHDTHHRHPNTNYGVTNMLWDKSFNTYKYL